MNKLYWRWYAMKSLCLNKNHPKFEKFGGAGVTICDKWKTFKGFVEDMGHVENARLVRIDRSQGYSKENCFWKLPGEKKTRFNRELPRGVSVKGKGFKAQITLKGRSIYLGKFNTPNEAHEAFIKAKNENN